MASPLSSKFCICGLLLLGLLLGSAEGFGWGMSQGSREYAETNSANPAHTPHVDSRPSNAYSMALTELQNLESEPLCHRIAARLLVHNCQLLDGQDEATVLTDSGREARDFVDFYAASLAICDLERGSFVIPTQCAKFRESTLSTIALPSQTQLHVTKREIEACLQGLAQSDSAWVTWVSYRHKALRFCEAARADNDKDRTIHLYQRVTNIMEKLTTDIEAELGARFNSLEKVIHETRQDLETLSPNVDRLRAGLGDLEIMISKTLSQTAMESAGIIKGGLEDATNLQRLLSVLVQTILDGNAEAAAFRESSLQVATQANQQMNNEVGVIMTALAAVVASSTSLQHELDTSQYRAAEIAYKQQKIEAVGHLAYYAGYANNQLQSMERLEGFAHTLSQQQAHHQESLEKAHLVATRLTDTLEIASSSATTLGASVSKGLGLSGWWPYIFCPAASLVMGSYGLPPSAGRNILLIGLGEVAGFAVSSAHQYIGVFFPSFAPPTTGSGQLNMTSATGDPNFLTSNFVNRQDLPRAPFEGY